MCHTLTFTRKYRMKYKKNIVFILCFNRVCFISRLVTDVGISVDGMRKHVMREIPGLAEKGISRDAIDIIFQPPRKNLTRCE